MTDKKPSNLSVSQQGGVVRNVLNQLKLIYRLMADSRVSVLAKIIPIGALAYLILPTDLLPGLVLPGIGALDDAAVLWLGSYIFTELCPPAVVQEHMKALSSNLDSANNQDEVIDADATDISDKSA